MGRVKIAVGLDPLPSPDYSRTINSLGAWETVDFTIRRNALAQVSFEITDQNGCRHVNAVAYTLRIEVAYRIASELRERAERTPDRHLRTKHRQILDIVRTHAANHYNRMRTNVIPTWRREAEQRIDRALPSAAAPTSATSVSIQRSLDQLVRHWISALGSRMLDDVFRWDSSDYPHLEERFRRIVGHRMQIPRPARPRPFRQGAPTLVFPRCVASR